jgi:hypothetical protein
MIVLFLNDHLPVLGDIFYKAILRYVNVAVKFDGDRLRVDDNKITPLLVLLPTIYLFISLQTCLNCS